jgi:hypothetical protein
MVREPCPAARARLQGLSAVRERALKPRFEDGGAPVGDRAPRVDLDGTKGIAEP